MFTSKRFFKKHLIKLYQSALDYCGLFFFDTIQVISRIGVFLYFFSLKTYVIGLITLKQLGLKFILAVVLLLLSFQIQLLKKIYRILKNI